MTDTSRAIVERDPTFMRRFRDNGDGSFSPLTAVGASVSVAGAVMTRPGDTNAYAIGDLIANSVTANAVVPIAFVIPNSGLITGATLTKTGTGVSGAAFNLHLFGVSPTVTNGDNGVWLPNQAANYLMQLQISSMKALSDGAVGSGIHAVRNQAPLVVPAGGATIYGLMEAGGAYAPGNSESFTWALDLLRD